MTITKEWHVYLAGEIHSNWREEITKASESAGLPVTFSAPITNHEASDNCGEMILGSENNEFWKDHKAAKINRIRNYGLIQESDIVVVRFSDKYRQWNAAFDAGLAVAFDKPLITVHPDEFTHALKEIDAAAMAVTQTTKQVFDILTYITST